MRIRGYDIIFKAIVGSHSYGTNVEGSDVDYKGVYIQTPKDVLYNGYTPQFEIGKDETYYEVGRFLSLCEKANPTVLELLYTPEDCVVFKDPIFDTILKRREMFLTKRCRFSFGGYAVEQIIKAKSLDKKMNWENNRIVRKDILDFCFIRERGGSLPLKRFLENMKLDQMQIGLVALPHMRYCYGLYWDTHRRWIDFKPAGIAKDLLKSNDISLTAIPSSMEQEFEREVSMYFNKDAYSTHCKEYKEYQQWLENRNTLRYVDVASHGQKIDGKNLLHCTRLLQTAMEIPVQKVVNVRRPNAKYLVEIRKGHHNLQSIIEACEADIKKLDKTFEECGLPENVSERDTKALTISVRELFESQSEIKEHY